MMNPIEIKKRQEIAINSIKAAYGTDEDEFGGTLFVSHHLEEIDSEYWKKHLGTANPDPKDVLNIIQLKKHWDDDSVFDFTLPGDVTDYVISVRFSDDGSVEEITMES